MTNAVKSILVVIPCLNEEAHLQATVEALLSPSPALPLQVVIADGGSIDKTREVAQNLMARFPNLMWLDNPKRNQAAAVNLAVQKYGQAGGIVIRVDAHAGYPPRYVDSLVEEMRRTSADSIVVPMDTVGVHGFQCAVAAAQNSKLGNGGSAHRTASGGGKWVDHGHHALMTIDAFRAVGGYDETFAHNEDAELDMRLRHAGYRIWLTEAAVLTYVPRRTALALFRQYRGYGYGRARNLFKHRQIPRLRQMIPVFVAPACVLALLFPVSGVFMLPLLVWAGVCLGYGALLGLRENSPIVALSGPAAMIMHAAWSVGFWQAAGAKMWGGL
jgi:succinoglycan biosynthesis protein ExoA